MRRRRAGLDGVWRAHDSAWRDPAQVASQWYAADSVDPALLRSSVRGAWWEALSAQGVTLLVTREYEHLIVALRGGRRGPAVSFMPMPHPSGLAVDRRRQTVHVASTRNPNLVFDLAPVTEVVAPAGARHQTLADRPLVPMRARYFPGALYLHDLAIIGGVLHANAVGQNAVIRLHDDGRYEPVWWPRSVESPAGPRFDRNYLQLNSIAAGPTLRASFFSASAATPSTRRPGHRNFPVDGLGVIFSGASRAPIARGLTRPHSARLHRGRVWVCNSGYGEVGFIADGAFVPVVRLPGWTRGLCFAGSVAFVGTSRVIPRFRAYAPGLDAAASVCGLHAVDTRTGAVLGSLRWPVGNQIFGIESMPSAATSGFPTLAGARRAGERERALYYSFVTARRATRRSAAGRKPQGRRAVGAA
jgi:uncharacterized protein (TIGR03032 family)